MFRNESHDLLLSRVSQYVGIMLVLGILGGGYWYWKQAQAGVTQKSADNDGLVGYWSFDEGTGTQAGDASGNGNTGTLTNGPTWVDGKLGKAVSFDGTNDYVVLPDASLLGLSSATSEKTVSAWIKTTQGTAAIVSGRNEGLGNPVFDLQLGFDGIDNSGTGYPSFLVRDDSGNGLTHIHGTAAINDGAWHHVVATRNASKGLVLYVDGDQVASGTDSMTNSLTVASTHSRIGDEAENGGILNMNGSIDEVRIYDRALGATEVGNIYALGAAKFQDTQSNQLTNGLIGYWPFNGPDIAGATAYDRAGSNNGTLTGGPARTIGRSGQALDFDGTDDYVNGGAAFNFTSSDFSISHWVKLDSLSTNQAGQGPVLIYKGKYQVNGYYSQVSTTDGQISFTTNQSGVSQSTWSVAGSVGTSSWHHVVYVRSGSSVRIYVDGLDKTRTAASHINPTSSSDGFLAGYYNNGGAIYMNGKLDEVRVYDRSLSASEIWDLYQLGNPDKVNSADSQGDSLEKGIVGYWKLDDASGTSAADSSGNSYTGTLTNGPTWTTGRIGGAANFDGTNDYVNAGDVLDNLTSFTLTAWVNHNTISDKDMIIQKWSTTYGFQLFRDDIASTSGRTDTYSCRVTDQASDGVLLEGTTGVSPQGAWTFVACTFVANTSGGLRLFVNGAEDAQSPANTTNVDSTGGHSSDIGIGYNNAQSSAPLNGSIDEVRIYNRVLSPEEIAKLYKTTAPDNPDTGLVGYWSFNGQDISGTTAYDRSGKGNNGTMTNGPTRTIGKAGQALSFDGTDDSVVVGNSTTLNPTAALSVSAWAFRRSDTATYHLMVYKENYGGSAGYVLGKLSGSAPLGFRVNGSGGNSYVAYESSATYDQWTHYIGVFDGDKVYLYKNGALVDTEDPPFTTISADTDILEISSAWNGNIDEVRVYSRALTQSEITTLYNAGR